MATTPHHPECPSLVECTSILSAYLDTIHNHPNDDNSVSLLDSWRVLVERCLSFQFHTTAAAAADQEGRSPLLPHGGDYGVVGEGGQVLAASLDWYYRHCDNDKARLEDDDLILRAVVDGLWAAGAAIVTTTEVITPSSTATTAASAKGDDTNDLTQRGITSSDHLARIIQHLSSTPRPPSGNVGNSAANTKNDNNSSNDNSTILPSLLPIPMLQGVLELSTLQASNLLPPPPPASSTANAAAAVEKEETSTASSTIIINKRIKKLITDLYYRQTKFNLLAEESQGYAKLITYLLSLLTTPPSTSTTNDAAHNAAASSTTNDATTTTVSVIKSIHELIGIYKLEPNRVLDVTIDILEWGLYETMIILHTTNGNSSSGVNKKKNKDDGCNAAAASTWGYGNIQSVMKLLLSTRGTVDDGTTTATTTNHVTIMNNMSHLLAIIRELDGTTITNKQHDDDDIIPTNDDNVVVGDGVIRRCAVVHLLGFKYRNYYTTAAATSTITTTSVTTTMDATNGGEDGNVLVTSAPSSLHLLVAYLSIMGILDPHELIPHLIAITAFTTPARKTNSTVAATSLLQQHVTYQLVYIEHLKKLGVVSLNSSSKSKGGGDDSNNNNSSSSSSSSNNSNPLTTTTSTTAVGGEGGGMDNSSFSIEGSDPVIAIFRALLAVGGEWDTAVAFLAHAAYGSELVNMAKNTGSGGGEEEDTMYSAVDLVLLAACTLSKGVAEDISSWVDSKIDDIVLVKDDNENAKLLAELSSRLLGPLTALAKSGRICAYQNLYIKLCRIYSIYTQRLFKTNNQQSMVCNIDEDTMSVLTNFLVPSLSLFPPDTTLPDELWSVLTNLPYDIRYKLYSTWRRPGLEKVSLRIMSPKDVKIGIVPKPLANIESEIQTGISFRKVFRRISKENIAIMGRQLAQTSHNNPLVVFTDILDKIESYDNMILMMVDTFQFITKLGLDVMGYCLLVSLGGGEDVGQKNRTKMGGLNTEQWLSSLETFTGAFYKKFPLVEMRGILMYITKRFKDGHASELGILRSLIKTVGGYGFVSYDSTASLSDLQLDGRRGSRLLKRETSSFGVVEDINRDASNQLRSILQGNDLGVIILILLSQIRSRVLFSKTSETVKQHVKVLGNLYDECQALLCLLLEYLSDSSDDSTAKEKFTQSMPSLSSLCTKYGMETAVAWMLCRPFVKPTYLSSTASTENLIRFPEAAMKHITPTMFETFYSLAIYDISCPEERYTLDIERLKKDCDRLLQLQQGGDAARGQMSALAAAAAAAGGNSDQIRQATAYTSTHAAHLDRLKCKVDQLSTDFQRQLKRCNLVLTKLEAQKKSLIGTDHGQNKAQFASAFMTFCIYQRCFLSPEDSLYCAHFVKLLHKIQVPDFPTIELIDIIVNAVVGSLYCTTEDEAGNMAIFLNEIWKSVNSWRYDNDAFTSELKDTPGSQLSKEFAEKNGFEHRGITHDDYKSLYSQWHKKLGTATIGCLESAEYMHTRASLIVLSRIVSVFPTQPKIGEHIIKTLAPLQSEDNERPDIRATAQGYCSQLMKARDEGMWKEESIAVTRARQLKEKMKAEEKKKMLAQKDEEMKKESESISRQLGDGGRDNWRQDRRDGRDERGRHGGGFDSRNSRAPPLNVAAPAFTPKNRVEEVRESHSRSTEPRRPGMDREGWDRDRGNRQGESRDVQRPIAEPGRGERRKRSRSPEPGEDTERSTQKRSRGDVNWAPPRRSGGSDQQPSNASGGAGGTRRSERGGGGSSRY